MSRPAQDVLEFDKLRDLLRQRTTCAPGRRFIGGLEPANNRAALDGAFVLIREAHEWLRLAREVGFGALADPEKWLERLEAPGAVLEPTPVNVTGPPAVWKRSVSTPLSDLVRAKFS